MSIRVMSSVWDNFPGAGGSELLVLLAFAMMAAIRPIFAIGGAPSRTRS